MYAPLISQVQYKLESNYREGADLIGEFWDSVKKVLIQHYQCAHIKGNTTLVIAVYDEFGPTIHYVEETDILR